MYRLSLELLRRTVDPGISGFSQRTIKTGPAPVRVYRLNLAYRAGADGPPSIVAKVTAPNWPDDPDSVDRENRFYQRILPCLDIPHAGVIYSGVDQTAGHRLLLLEDLAVGYVFQPVRHRWSPDEVRCIVRAYARLHALGQAALPPREERGWLMPRHEAYLDVVDLASMVTELGERRLLSPLPGIGNLIEWTMAQAGPAQAPPATLLHNDVYPTNVALPRDLTRDAVLIDWQMVGWGLPELDVAYLFMQPFRNARAIDQNDALSYYWEQRELLDGIQLSRDERDERKRYADALLALSFLPAAARVAKSPYAERTLARAYWDAMYRVLNERLLELCR